MPIPTSPTHHRTGVIRDPAGDVLSRHPALRSLSAELDRSGQWRRWCAADHRLAGLATLDDAVRLRATPADERANAERARDVVAALVERGCVRGGDDPDAALAVVVLLADGISRVARQIEDLCDVGDVVDTVWERVRAATPRQGPAAASFLLRRTRETLVLHHHRGTRAEGARILPMADPPEPADVPTEPEAGGAMAELRDLLTWATGAAVIEPDEAALLLDLVTAGHQVEATTRPGRTPGEVYARLADRRGVCARTLRRRRQRAIDRLRRAHDRYLADAS